MRRGDIYACDRCGETAPATIAGGIFPPARWLCAFNGSRRRGPHACSTACWRRLNEAHRQATGKSWIVDSRPIPEPGPRPEPVDVPPACFELLDDIDIPLIRRGGSTPGAPLRRESAEENPPPAPREFGRRARPTFLYFVQEIEDGPIKIGVSAAPLTRLSSLQVANPRPLRLLSSRPGSGADEAELHKRLARHRIRGEWFAPVPDVLAAATGA